MRKKSDLHDYQDSAVSYLYERDGALALMGTGSGKTVTCMTALQELIEDGVIGNALVFAPSRVSRLVWPKEPEEWEHLNGKFHMCNFGGPPKDWGPGLWTQSRELYGKRLHRERRLSSAKAADKIRFKQELEAIKKEERAVNRKIRALPRPEDIVYVSSYENLEWLCELFKPGTMPFDAIVFDEIGKLKNPKSSRYKAVKRHIEKGADDLIVWGLNATPAPEGLQDLFTQATLATRSRLWGKSFYKWRDKYFMPADYHGYTYEPTPGSEAKILKDLDSIAFKIPDEALAYRKTIEHSQILVDLPSKAREMYKEMKAKMAMEMGDLDVVAMSAAASAMKLRQITQGFIYDEDGQVHILHEEKTNALAELLDGMNRDPLLIAYDFEPDLAAIQKVYKGIPYIGSGVSNREVEDHIERWNRGELPAMAIHPKSGGHGLNLQKSCAHICWFTIPWSLEEYQQTNDRIDRQGQTRRCYGHHIVVENSTDQKVSSALQVKDATQRAIIQAIRSVT